MPNWKKVIVSGSQAHLAAVTASSQITINSVAASSEAGVVIGPPPAGGAGEGGQLALQPASGFTSGSFIDVYQTGTTPYIRLLRGTAASSDALVTQWNLHTKQFHLPAYNSISSFSGTAVAALGVNSSGDVITIATGSGGGSTFPYTGIASINGGLVVTGSITASGAIHAQANGTMYFRGGDDAEFWDINLANHVGIYGQQNPTMGAVKLGNAGPILYGSGSNLAITGSLFVSASQVNHIYGGLRIYGAGRWFDSENVVAIDVESRTLNDANGSMSVDISSRYLNEPVNNITTVDWAGTRLYDTLGQNSANWSDRTQQNASGVSVVDWGNSVLNDNSGIVSLDWSVRKATDSSGVVSIDYENRTLLDVGEIPSVDYNNRVQYDGLSSQSIDWENRVLQDENGNHSVNWRQRRLYNAAGTTIVNWNGTTGTFNGTLNGTASWASNVVGGIGVTSVDTTGNVSGITLTGGTITSTGTITLGGSISGLTTSNLSGTAGITNAQLANSSVTIGSTGISLGGTSTTLAGLTNVNSTNFTGSLQGNVAGTASWATNVVNNGVTSVGGTGTVSGITLTGTVTSTGNLTLGGSISGLTNSNLSGTAGITNANLANSSVTVGTTVISLGSSATTIAGLASLNSTNLTGSLLGNVAGTASWATNATTAASASSILASTVTGIVPVPFMSQKTPGVASYLGGDTILTYNTSTGTLNATAFSGTTFTGTTFTGTTFNGALSGNATTATTAETASAITIINDGGTTGPLPVLFALNTGSRSARADVGVFSFNPIADLLTVPNVSSSGTITVGAITASRLSTNSITGSAIFSGSFNMTGSFRGEVGTLTITSQTASVNLDRGNMFTLTLANNVTTHIAFTNIRPGQTANIRVTQGSSGNGAVAFQSVVKQPTGSAYTGSQVANAIDILSLVTFDSTDVYVSSVRRLL